MSCSVVVHQLVFFFDLFYFLLAFSNFVVVLYVEGYTDALILLRAALLLSIELVEQHLSVFGFAARLPCSSLGRARLLDRGLLLLGLGPSAPSLLLDEGSAAGRLLDVIVAHHELHDILHSEGVAVDCRLHGLLLLGSLHNLLLDGALSHDAIHRHRLGLANPVRPVRRLFVHRRVPVVVVENDGVCGDQVDAKTARSRR